MHRKINTKVKLRNSKKVVRGLILVDILLAMSLAVLFVVLITQSSSNSRYIFEYSKERNRLMDIYEAHATEFENMMPYETRKLIVDGDGWKYSTTTIDARARWYGNDRIQTDIIMRTGEFTYNSATGFTSSTTASSATSTTNVQLAPYAQSLTFNSVRAYPLPNTNDFAGTTICSVDFSNKNTLGSYGYQLGNNAEINSLPNPQSLTATITPIILPIDSSIPITDLQVRNGRAYISTDSSKLSDPDIIMADIHDPSNVELNFDVSTGPGLSSIALVGNRVFAAMTSRTAQLQVIRIPYLGGMLVESSYKLPLPYATATPAIGSAIFYDRNQVYLGTEKWDGEEFNVIDVNNPSAPTRLGGLETGSKVGGIFVRNGIAYVTASDQKQLRVIDVRDPVHPILLDSISPSGWERQEGKSLSFFEDLLGLGRTSGGFNIKTDHELFSWGTTTIAGFQSIQGMNPPIFLGGVPLLNIPPPHSVDISGGVYGIVADHSFVYLISKQLGKEFQIYNHIFSTTTMKTISLPATPQMLTCDGDSLYVLAGNAPVIYKINFK